MGLDMYLSKKTYVKNWDHDAPDKRHEITVKLNGLVRTDIKPERITYITEQVAYWRKANAIHKWFVDNVQDGNDDCGDYDVSVEQLRELVGACKQVLASSHVDDGKVYAGTEYKDGVTTRLEEDGKIITNPEIAESFLPTQEGFFFGGTDYNEWYLRDLQETIDQLEPLLAEPDNSADLYGGEYYYHSSW